LQRLAITLLAGAALAVAVCGASSDAAEPSEAQVLFVCEHGNVKSLMAASYFNQLAKERGLPLRGISRASAPNSTTVPPNIASALRAEGFDVSDFHPAAVRAADVAAAKRVITIGTTLPASIKTAGLDIEQWNDVPPASTQYFASRDSLRNYVRELIERLERTAP
jgi:arsenate reductase (thioredoxin)